MTDQNPHKETLLTFPCEFTIKLFGYSDSAFEQVAIDIFEMEIERFRVQKRASKESKYLALSVTFTAESQAQLDDLYKILSSTPEIMMVL